MRRTRSSSKSSAILLADYPEKMAEKMIPEEHKRLRRSNTSSMGDNLLRGTEDCWISRSGFGQKEAPQSATLCITNIGNDPAVGSGGKVAAQCQPRSCEKVMTEPPSTMTTDSLTDTKYNLRRNKIFTSNSDKPQNFECMLKSYYNNLFAGSDKEGQIITDAAPRSEHKMMLTDLKGHTMDEARMNTLSGDSPSDDRTTLVGHQSVRDNASRVRSCLRHTDHSHKRLSHLSSARTPTFEYVLRSNHCLLKQKRSFIEKLGHSLERQRQNSGNHFHTATPSLGDGGYRNRRKVSFLEPQWVGQKNHEDAAVMGDIASRSRCSVELVSGGLVRNSENVSQVKDAGLWGRSTTVLIGIIIGLRMLFDTYSDNLDVFRSFDLLHLFGNRSSVK